MNGKARILFVNGITGQGAWEFSRLLASSSETAGVDGSRMRFTLPTAVCSYCFGETRIGEEHQQGTLRKIRIPEASG